MTPQEQFWVVTVAFVLAGTAAGMVARWYVRRGLYKLLLAKALPEDKDLVTQMYRDSSWPRTFARRLGR